MRRRFQQVDVFTTTPYAGNPVAVVLDGEGLTQDQMEHITRWTNLSEAAFVLPPTRPEADYRVRIFAPLGTRGTTAAELPFAGHPTLGTCHAWLGTGGRPKRGETVVQESPAGLIRIRRDDDRLAFAAPPVIRSGPAEDALVRRVASMLRIDRDGIVDAAWCDNGPGWIGVLLASAEAVLALEPGTVDMPIGVVGPYPAGSPAAFEVRAFFPKQGATAEDPVTGSLNASLAPWLLDAGRAGSPYVASQGTVLGCVGRVHIHRDGDGTVWVGGRTITCISGHVEA
ncbi:MAG TPA: PhzF family phenazine biosynthesis protein [bacterium]|nr:PhzF family phenazine biosynthesis protein [bacterium]